MLKQLCHDTCGPISGLIGAVECCMGTEVSFLSSPVPVAFTPISTDICPHLHPSLLWHCWLGDRKGIRPAKCWMLVGWWWRFGWSFVYLIAPVVITTISIIFSSTRVQSGDILVPAYPGCPGKWPLNEHSFVHSTRPCKGLSLSPPIPARNSSHRYRCRSTFSECGSLIVV